jgi:hypothetical protein
VRGYAIRNRVRCRIVYRSDVDAAGVSAALARKSGLQIDAVYRYVLKIVVSIEDPAVIERTLADLHAEADVVNPFPRLPCGVPSRQRFD